MKKILFFMLLAVIPHTSLVAAEQGAYLGAESSEMPDWFKESFLEFEEDVAEAAADNKRIMIYFHQEGCPYCAKLVNENFKDPALKAYVQEHFDGIQINMWGDREIVSVGGKSFTEKTFAAALKVQYTPTMLFLNEQGKVALRLNGYYPPQQFRQALKYVAQKEELNQSFNEFMLAKQDTREGTLIHEDFFLKQHNLQQILNSSSKPLAIYFETANCSECETLHNRVLSDPPTRALVNKMNNVQLNAHSNQLLITPEGDQLSHKDYAKKLNIGYTPSVVLLDSSGQEVHRMDGFLKTFHFQSSLDYVLERAYLEQPSFQRYISARGEKLREMGFDTDIWGYQSFHPAETKE
ncbi:MAG: thioredoxin fold domain-containing protein [Gammaproteobacteria bacterium]|nr:thioredoxin fold domain-containing protein [Gammaproteobacteria bacterium]